MKHFHLTMTAGGPLSRDEIAGRIKALIALLDRLDGDPDAEPAGDDEPSLGWTLTMAHGNRDDLEERETPALIAGDRE